MFYELSDKIYVCIDNHWFDLTDFKNHPGGVEILQKYHLNDGTKDFNSIRGHYDEYVVSKLEKYEIKNTLLRLYLNMILTGGNQLKF
jgi:cytochrome b involved in lipid metabolism